MSQRQRWAQGYDATHEPAAAPSTGCGARHEPAAALNPRRLSRQLRRAPGCGEMGEPAAAPSIRLRRDA